LGARFFAHVYTRLKEELRRRVVETRVLRGIFGEEGRDNRGLEKTA
jgi:hypothetical protein